jgi:hypothetical protein
VNVPQDQKAEPEYGEDINPISRLIQIQQAKKEREPVYSLLDERGMPRRREFVMEVSMRNRDRVQPLLALHLFNTNIFICKFKIFVPSPVVSEDLTLFIWK